MALTLHRIIDQDPRGPPYNSTLLAILLVAFTPRTR